MKNPCDEYTRHFEGRGGVDGAVSESWLEHLDSCTDCREQADADAALRSAFSTARSPGSTRDAALDRSLRAGPDTGLGDRLDDWLAGELEIRARGVPKAAPKRHRWGARWALAAYATLAGSLSLWVLSTVSWPAVSPVAPLAPLAATITFGALALLTPLVLFDRLGVLRPPG